MDAYYKTKELNLVRILKSRILTPYYTPHYSTIPDSTELGWTEQNIAELKHNIYHRNNLTEVVQSTTSVPYTTHRYITQRDRTLQNCTIEDRTADKLI